MRIKARVFFLLIARVMTSQIAKERISGALWALFSGDALAAPTHWYYDTRQISVDYGEIKDYTKPVLKLPGSIMAKSNTDGAGRGTYNQYMKTVIGDFINIGKKRFWSPHESYHYHCTLEKGENTLEAQLVRVLLGSIIKSSSTNSQTWADQFRQDYIHFMTTPNSHNDAYASTAHRMFFRNLLSGIPEENCPDNDHHNVDTIDGLVLPTVSALTAIYLGQDQAAVRQAAIDIIRVTRNSRALERAAYIWVDVLYSAFFSQHLDEAIFENAAAQLGVRLPPNQSPDPVVS